MHVEQTSLFWLLQLIIREQFAFRIKNGVPLFISPNFTLVCLELQFGEIFSLLWLITSTSQYEIMARGFSWSCRVWINLHSLRLRPSVDEEMQTLLKLQSQTLKDVQSACSFKPELCTLRFLDASILWRGNRKCLAKEEKNIYYNERLEFPFETSTLSLCHQPYLRVNSSSVVFVFVFWTEWTSKLQMSIAIAVIPNYVAHKMNNRS